MKKYIWTVQNRDKSICEVFGNEKKARAYMIKVWENFKVVEEMDGFLVYQYGAAQMFVGRWFVS